MGDTGISYADKSWNCVVGCTPISEGCAHCWSKALHDQRCKAYKCGKKLPAQYVVPFTFVHCMTNRLAEPLHWRLPRIVFVCSGADLFHDDVTDEFIASVFGVMAACPQHTFLVLTKRAERMRRWFDWANRAPVPVWQLLFIAAGGNGVNLAGKIPVPLRGGMGLGTVPPPLWPLPNVWLGVTIENQRRANERILHLLATPAVHRWISYEPALERVKFPIGNIDYFVIAGGESGPNARQCDAGWFRDVNLAQLASLNHKNQLRFHIKQLGSNAIVDGQQLRLRQPHGADPAEWPEDLRAMRGLPWKLRGA